MGFFRRIAFYLGLILGLATIAVAGIVALTYLLTGKLVSIETSGEKPEVTLMTPDEVIVLVREQANKAQAAAQQAKIAGGENDE
jgi:hypothetical protein